MSESEKSGQTRSAGPVTLDRYDVAILRALQRDARQSNAKYLVDFYNYEDWANQAKTDGQMEILANVTPVPDTLFSWVAHYDGATKSKTPVTGVCLLNASTMDVRVVIMDAQHDVEDSWHLTARSCRLAEHGKRSPQLLATDSDLQGW